MADEKKTLTPEDEQKLKEYVDDQASKIGEIYSQCWESDEFKQAFIENPKAIFKEYGVNYEDSLEYKIIDTPDKTMIHVLPYKNTKGGVAAFCDKLMKQVEDLSDEDEKQLLLEGWCYQIYQNTEDTVYLPIPISPENLSPEELQMVNGGCLILAVVVLIAVSVEAGVTVSTTFVAAEFVVLGVVALLGAVAEVAAAITTVVLNYEIAFTTVATTGAIGISNDITWDPFSSDKNK